MRVSRGVIILLIVALMAATVLAKTHKKHKTLTKKTKHHSHKKVANDDGDKDDDKKEKKTYQPPIRYGEHLLPHPDQSFTRDPKGKGKKTPGKSCSSYDTCQDCHSVFICVWAPDGNCVENRDPSSVLGTRTWCPDSKRKGQDVLDRDSQATAELTNNIVDAQVVGDKLPGRVFTIAQSVEEEGSGPGGRELEKIENGVVPRNDNPLDPEVDALGDTPAVVEADAVITEPFAQDGHADNGASAHDASTTVE